MNRKRRPSANLSCARRAVYPLPMASQQSATGKVENPMMFN
jgi:hypothetical protein